MLSDVTRLDIERDGLERTTGSVGVSVERKDRHDTYLAHLERMKTDEEYRERWMRNERDLQESIKRDMYY